LFKKRAEVCFLAFYNHGRRCLWASLLPIISFLLLLSPYSLGIFGTQESDAYASAQYDDASVSTKKPNSLSGRTTDFSLIGDSSPVSNKAQFLNYTNSTYGIQIKYPSNWNIVPLEKNDSLSNETILGSEDLQIVAKFSSPARDNLTISKGNLANNSGSPDTMNQFINDTMQNTRNTFVEYRLLDLRMSSNKGTNTNLAENGSRFEASTSPVIFNLTYSGERNNGNDRSHLRGMDVGAIVNNTAYVISYLSTVEDYLTYLPIVLDMIYSLEVSDLNRSTVPKSSSSQVTISSPLGSSSNVSATPREQNTVIGAETTDSSPDNSNTNTGPQSLSQQATPNYDPSTPSASPDTSYPTTQLYPPGYSPYPPPDYLPYSPYTGYSPYTDYSPYTGYSPYTDYSPYVLEPVIPTTPFIPPVDYTNPTIQSYNTFNDTAGVFHIVGEVENSSPYIITSVQVIAAFYDNLNQLLAVKFANTNPSNIPPGQIAFFDLTIPPGTIPVDSISQWTLRLVWQ
jgi:hypothetical protein